MKTENPLFKLPTSGHRLAARYPLDRRVLAVLVLRVDGWKAYVGAVPGARHEDEAQAVAERGSPLPEHVALALWPEMRGTPYAR